MKKITILFAVLFASIFAWGENVDFNFTSQANLLGWSATTAPGSYETADPSRGLAWYKATTTLTYTLDGYGITKVTIIASANNAGYTLAINDGTPQSVTKSNNTTYEFDVTVNDGETVSISTTKNDYVKSFWIKSISFTKATGVSVNKPTISPASGEISGPQAITITADGGATIYYTTDGSTPTTSSTQYTGAFNINTSCTVKAIAVIGENESTTTTAEYTQTVYASLAALVAACEPAPTTTGRTVSVSFEDVVIKNFYVSSKGFTNGVFVDATTEKEIEIYCTDVPEGWVVGGRISGTLTDVDWKTYSGTWELCPTSWDDISYTAPTYYGITINNVTGGTINASATENILEGTVITLSCAVASGYAFNSWVVKDNNNNPITVTENKFDMPAGNVTVTATYDEVTTYDIVVVDPEGGTIVSVIEHSPAGAIINISFTPSFGYQFKGWDVEDEDFATVTVSGGATDGSFTMPAKDVLITAQTSRVNSTIYYLVTDASQLQAGDVIVLGYDNETVTKVNGATTAIKDGGYYMSAIDATLNSDKNMIFANSENALEIKLGGNSTDGWTLTTSEGAVCAGAAKALNSTGTNTWTIAINAEKKATITSTDSEYGSIQYNAGSPRFLNYTSNQGKIKIYRKPGIRLMNEAGTVEAGWVNFGALTAAETTFGDIKAYKLSYSNEIDNTESVTIEISGATDDNMEYFDASISNNADILVSYANIPSNPLTDKEFNGYLDVNAKGTYGEDVQVQFPIYLAINPTGAMPSTPTSVDNTNAAEVSVKKVVRDGQLYIIREGVTYNALGAVVE